MPNRESSLRDTGHHVPGDRADVSFVRAPITIRSRHIGALSLALAGLLTGCAASPRAAETVDLHIPSVYTVFTPGTLWVGDALGLHMLASHDPELAIAISRGPDKTGAFWMTASDTQSWYATVPELED